MAYCAASDLYLYGLPRGALASPGRLVESVSTTANTFELDQHGYATDDAIQVRVAGGGTLPTPLAPRTNYFVIVVDAWHFQLSASAGGSAIDITAAGTTFVVYSPLPIDAALDKASRLIDDMLPAHVVPLAAPYPDVIKMTCAELAASDLLALTGGASVPLTAIYDAARRRLDRWSKGVPIRGTDAPEDAQLAVASVTTRAVPSWKKYGGIA